MFITHSLGVISQDNILAYQDLRKQLYDSFPRPYIDNIKNQRQNNMDQQL